VVIGRVLKGVSAQTLAAAQGREHTGEVADAYALGQLSFAQQLASLASHTSIDQEFLVALKAGKFIPFLTALYDGERTNKQLKAIVAQTDENVSRRMKELRELGITDFRKDGTLAINFLTPVARQILTAEREAADEHQRTELSELKPGVGALLKSLTSDAPRHMRTAPTFEQPVSQE
jgi:hypothetical protein